MKKQLYLDIKNRLKDITAADGEPVFKHFDLWNQQVEFLEEETPFLTPAIFIEFLPHEWKTLGNRRQHAVLNIRIHIVTQWFAGTADYSPTEQQALEYLDIVDCVVAAMQNFSASSTNSWMRTRTVPNHNHERYVDNIEEYTCDLVDDSAVVTNATTVLAEPVVTPQND